MIRIRHFAIVLATLSSGALAIIACSSDSGRPTFDKEIPDSTTANLPEAAISVEAGEDAAADARLPFDPTEEVVTCSVEPCPKQIVAGQNHFCVVMSDKTVRCWGDGTVGAIGAPDEPDAGDPDAGDASDAADAADAADAGFVVGKVGALAEVVQISAAATTTCAVLGNGSVKCWGGNDAGQLGLSADSPVVDTDPHPAPSPVAVTGAVTRVDVGQRSACAILASGEVWCWGDNERGQLARPLATAFGGPAKCAALTGKIARTAAGTHTAFVVDDQGRLSSWGAVAGIEGAVSGRVASSSPDLVPSLLPVDSVSSLAVSSWLDYLPPFDGNSFPPERGLAHACAVAKGRLYCWGDSLVGAMGVGLPGRVVLPTAVIVRSDGYPQQVAVSRESTCVRLTDGSIQCAGDDAFGQLGRSADAGQFADFFTPASAFVGHAVRVAMSDTTTCALVQGGKVLCWGGNQHGELGQGTTDKTAHRAPVAVRF